MILKSTDGFWYGDPLYQGDGYRIETTDYGMRIVVRGPRAMNWNTVRRKVSPELRKALIPLSVGESCMAVFDDDYVRATSFDIRIREPVPVPDSFTARLNEALHA